MSMIKHPGVDGYYKIFGHVEKELVEILHMMANQKVLTDLGMPVKIKDLHKYLVKERGLLD